MFFDGVTFVSCSHLLTSLHQTVSTPVCYLAILVVGGCSVTGSRLVLRLHLRVQEGVAVRDVPSGREKIPLPQHLCLHLDDGVLLLF